MALRIDNLTHAHGHLQTKKEAEVKSEDFRKKHNKSDEERCSETFKSPLNGILVIEIPRKLSLLFC